VVLAILKSIAFGDGFLCNKGGMSANAMLRNCFEELLSEDDEDDGDHSTEAERLKATRHIEMQRYVFVDPNLAPA
jgi:hypothetical protein